MYNERKNEREQRALQKPVLRLTILTASMAPTQHLCSLRRTQRRRTLLGCARHGTLPIQIFQMA